MGKGGRKEGWETPEEGRKREEGREEDSHARTLGQSWRGVRTCHRIKPAILLSWELGYTAKGGNPEPGWVWRRKRRGEQRRNKKDKRTWK